jgi:hypothetical protein
VVEFETQVVALKRSLPTLSNFSQILREKLKEKPLWIKELPQFFKEKELNFLELRQ